MKGGCLHETHDAVKLCISELLTMANFKNTLEEKGCFSSGNDTSNRRPDISVFNMPGYDPKVVLDISITCPLPGIETRAARNLNAREAAIEERTAAIRYAAKISKYQGQADPEVKFQPIIIESTGRIESKSLKFIDHIISFIAQANPKYAVSIRQYWIRRISITLMKGITNAISKRAKDVQYNDTLSKRIVSRIVTIHQLEENEK